MNEDNAIYKLILFFKKALGLYTKEEYNKLYESYLEAEHKLSILQKEYAKLDSLKNTLNLLHYFGQKPLEFAELNRPYTGNQYVLTKKRAIVKNYEKPQDILILSSAFDECLSQCNIDVEVDKPKQVFDKILGWVQNNIRYQYDAEQYGKEECWECPMNLLVTKRGDCESVSMLVVSIYYYWLFKNHKYTPFKKEFADSVAYVGLGLYKGRYGHGFPCITLNLSEINSQDSFFKNTYVGEATLPSAYPSDCLMSRFKQYWMNWGLFSIEGMWKIKNEMAWWNMKGTSKRIKKNKKEQKEKMKEILKDWKR